jgi:hypothetical protein
MIELRQDRRPPTQECMIQRVPTQDHSISTTETPKRLTLIEKLTIAQKEWRKFFDSTGTRRVNRDIEISVENQRTNNYWGDELKEKEEGILRVYSSNVNVLLLTDKVDNMINIAWH